MANFSLVDALSETNVRGHEYHIQKSLGRFVHLQPQQLMTDIKLGKVFPLVIFEGTLATVGEKAKLGVPFLTCLRCIPLFENEVEVIEETHVAIRLRACANHIFRGGTVDMWLENRNGELIYHIDGYGYDNEGCIRHFCNLLFAKLGLWHLFIRKNVTPYAKRLENAHAHFSPFENIEYEK